MKLKDDATLSIAAAVSDVLEGKVKEEGKYPHDMFHPETGEKKVAKDEAEHKALADKGYTHDKPEVEEVAEPKAKGEKDFKSKHTVKKSGAKEDGSVVKEALTAIKLLEEVLVEALDKRKEEKLGKDIQKAIDKLSKLTDKMPEELEGEEGYDEIVAAMNGLEYGIRYYPDALKAYFKNNESVEEATITLDEAKLKAGKGKAKVDIDHTGDGIQGAEKQFKLKFKKHSKGYDVSGEKKNIVAFLQSKDYDMDSDDIEELFPELLEAKSKFQKPQVKKAVAIALKMGGNMSGAIKKIDQIAKGLSDDPEVEAALKLANESVTEEVLDEAHAMNEAKSKMQEDKERYQKFFKSALKKFGVTSPGELEGEKKKEFFNYVDKNYEADNETDKDESVKEDTIAEATYHNDYMWDGESNSGIKANIKDLTKKYPGLKFKHTGRGGGDVIGDTKKIEKFLLDDPNMSKAEVKTLLSKGTLGTHFGGIHFEESTIAEAQIRTSFESDEMKNVGGDKAAKKMGIKISFKKGKGDGYGGSDAGIFTGDEKKLVKYFQDYMGFDGKTFKELQKEFNEGTIAEAQIRTSFESDEMKNVGGDKAAKKLKIKISFKKGKGDGYMGSDAGIFTGDEKNLVKYFQDFMGFEGKTFKELQKEYS
jgi:hypothetical protein